MEDNYAFRQAELSHERALAKQGGDIDNDVCPDCGETLVEYLGREGEAVLVCRYCGMTVFE